MNVPHDPVSSPFRRRLLAGLVGACWLTASSSAAAQPAATDAEPRAEATSPPEPAPAPSDWMPPTRPPAPSRGTAPSAAPPEPSPASDEPHDAVDPLLYAGLGTAALGAAGMVVFGVAQSRLTQLQSEPGFEAYRAGQPVDSDVCQAADRREVVDGAAGPGRVRRICNEAATWETVSFVVLPTSIALLGVATYMIATGTMDDLERTADLRVVPVVGAGSGAVVVEGRF